MVNENYFLSNLEILKKSLKSQIVTSVKMIKFVRN